MFKSQLERNGSERDQARLLIKATPVRDQTFQTFYKKFKRLDPERKRPNLKVGLIHTNTHTNPEPKLRKNETLHSFITNNMFSNPTNVQHPSFS